MPNVVPVGGQIVADILWSFFLFFKDGLGRCAYHYCPAPAFVTKLSH